MNHHIKSLALAAAITLLGPPLDHAVFAASSPSFMRGRLVCAINVNRFLKHIGKRGTNSASAASFLKFRRVSHPRYGDVVFNWRGHGKAHIQVYIHNDVCLNPSSTKQRWIEQPCNRSWPRKSKIYLRGY